MKKILFALLFLALALPALAQPPAMPGNKLGWDQAAPTLAEAQAYVYKYYADGSTTGVALTSVTCAGTASPFQCEAPFPAFTPGNHTLAITTSNVAGESDKSAPLAFTFVVTPAIPTNLRVK